MTIIKAYVDLLYFLEHCNLKEPSYYTQMQMIFSSILNLTASYLSVFLDYCLKPAPYDYNPHQHVKIWLSSNKEIFLTQINQLRLIKMRSINPNDTIHFIYDSRLLTAKALDELKTFCEKHTIIPHNIPDEIIPACQTTEEKSLVILYEDEIFHLQEGGNLGAASDILRTLSPIYSLGTYTDFDVDINTQKLPPVLKVKEPVLVSFDKNTSQFCNDILIVTHPEKALAFIQIIQRAMIEACTPKFSNNKPFKWKLFEFNQPECQQKILNDCFSLGYSIRQYRDFASKIDEGILSLLLTDKVTSFEDLLHFLKPAQHNNKKNSDISPYGQYMIRLAVMNSTGPSLYVNAILKYMKNNLINSIFLYRFCGFISTYELNKYFKVQVLGADNNDLSWLPSGINKLREQERKMHESGLKLLTFFKKCKSEHEDKLNPSDPPLNPSKTIK